MEFIGTVFGILFMLVLFIGPIISFLGWIMDVIMEVTLFFDDVIDAISRPFRNAKIKRMRKEAARREEERLEKKRNLEENILLANKDGNHAEALRLFGEARKQGFSHPKQEALCYLRAADSLSFIATEGRQFDLAMRYVIRGEKMDPDLTEEASKLNEAIRERGGEQLALLHDPLYAGLRHMNNKQLEDALSAFQTAARQGCGFAAESTVCLMIDLAQSLDDCRKIEPWIEICKDLDCTSIDEFALPLKKRTLYFQAVEFFNQGDDKQAIDKCREGAKLGDLACAMLGSSACIAKYDDSAHYREGLQLAQQAVTIAPDDATAQKTLHWIKGQLAIREFRDIQNSASGSFTDSQVRSMIEKLETAFENGVPTAAMTLATLYATHDLNSRASLSKALEWADKAIAAEVPNAKELKQGILATHTL